jgi:hypothetical protein
VLVFLLFLLSFFLSFGDTSVLLTVHIRIVSLARSVVLLFSL